MTTVSLVECNYPVSLRSCGSSCNSPINRRYKSQQQFKCHSPDKSRSTFRQSTKSGSVCARPLTQLCGVSLSTQSLQYRDNPTAPVNTPQQPYHTPSTPSITSNSSESSIEQEVLQQEEHFTCRHKKPPKQQQVTKDGLLIVGQKPRIFSQYDLPPIPTNFQKQIVNKAQDVEIENLEDCPESVSYQGSPLNPPPSPVNYRPPLDGTFVIGGKKIECPYRAKSTQGMYYQAHDFKPGLVKEPTNSHCDKCSYRMTEHESLKMCDSSTINRRIPSRICQHIHTRPSTKSSMERRYSTIEKRYEKPSRPTATKDDGRPVRSFIDLYKRKKQQKEKEREKSSSVEASDALSRSKAGSTIGSASSSEQDKINHIGKDYEQIDPHGHTGTIELSEDSYCQEDTDAKDVSNFQNSQSTCFICEEENAMNKRKAVKPHGNESIDIAADERKEESSVFQSDTALSDSSLSYLQWLSSSSRLQSGRTPRSPKDKSSQGGGNSLKTTGEEILSEIETLFSRVRINMSLLDSCTRKRIHSSCPEWINLFSDHEQSSPSARGLINRECENFLNVLPNNISKSADVCFEAVVDKRYNRWRRRRRKKKTELDAELARRRRLSDDSESSSTEDEDNSQRENELERIIKTVYDEVNGRNTSNTSRETPRVRNRRRRKDGTVSTDPVGSPSDKDVHSSSNYDASSEWTSSESLLRSLSNSLEIHKAEVPNDDCKWPYYERYKKELIKRITSNHSPESLENKEWLPPISAKNESQPELLKPRSWNQQQALSVLSIPHQTQCKTPSLVPAGPARDSSDGKEKQARLELIQKSSETSDENCDWTISNTINVHIRRHSPKDKRLHGVDPSQWDEVAVPISRKRLVIVSNSDSQEEEISVSRASSTSFRASLKPIAPGQNISVTVSANEDNMARNSQDEKSQNIPYGLLKKIHTKMKPAMEYTKNAGDMCPAKSEDSRKEHKIYLPKLMKSIRDQTIPVPCPYSFKVQDARMKHKMAMKEQEIKPKSHVPGYTRIDLNKSTSTPISNYKPQYTTTAKMRINSHIPGLRKTRARSDGILAQARARKKSRQNEKKRPIGISQAFTYSFFNLPEAYREHNEKIKKSAATMTDSGFQSRNILQEFLAQA